MHVVCVTGPITGAEGVTGCGSITTTSDEADIQPFEFVTVNVYEPAGIPVTVREVPVPVIVAGPGVRVRVQVPLAGNPLSKTVPVETAQFG